MDQLIDTQVMVNPALTFDPVNQQSHVGRISTIIYQNDEVYVRFNDGKFGLYSADALLVLRPQEEILLNLREGIDSFQKSDILDMLNIYLLQASGNDGAISEAMYMAAFNDAVTNKTLIPLNEWIDRGLSNDRDTSKANGVSR
jgi:hypothetical protein